ncbi:Ubiquitin supergroup [Macleaya cordata]|uniref:Ubiquitin supergroup n=1 Tax=Macleaya cordata TaxID=56857 RepID=A0A200QL44_MACCD|nr:Ubiquitin supergroup [Macleaya cordata]
MRLVVEIMTGALFYVDVDDNATVADLKREIGSQEKLPVDRIIIILVHHNENNNQSVRLIDDRGLLVDCGIRDGSHIHLCFTPVDHDGGSPNHNSFYFTLPDSLFWYGPST